MLVILDDSILKSIADSIRTKTNTDNTFTPLEMKDAILSIEGSTDQIVLDNPGTENDLLLGKQMLDGNLNIINGKIPNATINTPVISVNADGTINVNTHYLKGYINSDGDVSNSLSLDISEVDAPSISISDDGVVNAIVNYTKGYITNNGDVSNSLSLDISEVDAPSISISDDGVVNAIVNYTKGYITNNGNKSNSANITKQTIANPRITINADGSISASVNYGNGYVVSGSSSSSLPNAIRTIYTGSGAPDNSLGVDGDIYLQI